MLDARALNNLDNLRSWRAWQDEAHRRSGFFGILVWVFPLLTIVPVFATTLYRREFAQAGVPAVLMGGGLYLAVMLGVLAFAVAQLNAWKRTHPWTPPS